MGDLEKKLGALLKLERERQNIKLEELEESLRIPLASLKQIENGNIDDLPSEVYFGLFAKSYSEALGIDYRATKEAIKQDIIEQEASLKANKRLKKEKEQELNQVDFEVTKPAESVPISRNRLVKRVGYVLLAIIIIVGGYFVIRQLFRDMKSGVQIESSGESHQQTNRPSNAKQNQYANFNWDVPKYEPPSDLKLELITRDNSWATVIADGDTAIFRKLTAGRSYTVTAKYRILLSVAVPRMVDIKLNDILIKPVSPTTGRISRVEITQVNVDSFLNPIPLYDEVPEDSIDSGRTDQSPSPTPQNEQSPGLTRQEEVGAGNIDADTGGTETAGGNEP